MSLVETIATLLTEKNATLSTAESCTGGLIGHWLTNLSGSSSWYMGGGVTYSNEMKMKLLGVRQDTLDAVGAVSAEVAAEMALGARRAFGTTYAVSVTGIAGPGGSTDTKPTGLTYIGAAGPDGVAVRRFVWQGSREGNKTSSVAAALELLISVLQGETEMNVMPSVPVSAVVETRLNANGSLVPTGFVWEGRTVKISDWGRQWEEGNTRHYLVMSGGSQTWELRFDRAAGVWSVKELTKAVRIA